MASRGGAPADRKHDGTIAEPRQRLDGFQVPRELENGVERRRIEHDLNGMLAGPHGAPAVQAPLAQKLEARCLEPRKPMGPAAYQQARDPSDQSSDVPTRCDVTSERRWTLASCAVVGEHMLITQPIVQGFFERLQRGRVCCSKLADDARP
jgi:hypothetical protein